MRECTRLLKHNCRKCTHTHPFNGPLFGTTLVSWYQKGKTNLDFTEARDSEWQWNQLGHIQVCTSLQRDNHANTPPLSFLQAECPSCRPTNSVKALKALCHTTAVRCNVVIMTSVWVADVMLIWQIVDQQTRPPNISRDKRAMLSLVLCSMTLWPLFYLELMLSWIVCFLVDLRNMLAAIAVTLDLFNDLHVIF